MTEKIAIQGFEASFHEAAAHKFFGDNKNLQYCLTFDKLFKAMEDGDTEWAVMAIENTVAGSILPNYARLRASNLQVIGEVFIRIKMNLMALPNQNLSAIESVHTHPMALLQCSAFLKKQPHISLVESNDTALSAKKIAENKIAKQAAIASKKAAELYGLEILGEGIETNKRNFTRFLVLSKNSTKNKNKIINKASWSFRTQHQPGSLANILTLLGEHEVNLTKIQSLPVLGAEWTYFFYADLEFEDQEAYEKVKVLSSKHTLDLKILGEYQQGEKYI